MVAAISRDLVGIHAHHFGRGPTTAKTIWRDEIVVCMLEEIFTRSEEVLVDSGRFEQVRANRQHFQDAVEPLMIAAVEAATGRPVRAFFSQVSQNGIVCDAFVLERPAHPGGGPDA